MLFKRDKEMTDFIDQCPAAKAKEEEAQVPSLPTTTNPYTHPKEGTA